jgi:hypothetical protein
VTCIACNRGEYIGSHRITDAASLAALSGYTSVTGGVEVDRSDLGDLAGLECLQEVAGTLDFFDNHLLRDVGGLRNLRTVGGDLAFGHCRTSKFDCSLESVGLTSLTSVGGALSIVNYSGISDISGLNRLSSVGGLSLQDLDVTTLDALSNLTAIRGDLYVGLNGQLTDGGGLGRVASIEGSVTIAENRALRTLGMASLATVGGDFDIQYNPILPTCEADNLLAQIIDVTGNANIEGNCHTCPCE